MLGKHSGRAAAADRVKALGYVVSAEQLQTIFERFKTLADRKKEIYDGDIAALCEENFTDISERWSFVGYKLRAPVAVLHRSHSE